MSWSGVRIPHWFLCLTKFHLKMKKIVILLAFIAMIAMSCGQSTSVKSTNDTVKTDSVKVDSSVVVK